MHFYIKQIKKVNYLTIFLSSIFWNWPDNVMGGSHRGGRRLFHREFIMIHFDWDRQGDLVFVFFCFVSSVRLRDQLDSFPKSSLFSDHFIPVLDLMNSEGHFASFLSYFGGWNVQNGIEQVSFGTLTSPSPLLDSSYAFITREYLAHILDLLLTFFSELLSFFVLFSFLIWLIIYFG